MARREPGQTLPLVRALRKDLLLDEESLAALGDEPAGFDSAPSAVAAVAADPHRFQVALLEHQSPTLEARALDDTPLDDDRLRAVQACRFQLQHDPAVTKCLRNRGHRHPSRHIAAGWRDDEGRRHHGSGGGASSPAQHRLRRSGPAGPLIGPGDMESLSYGKA